jgi:hypothetical protein
VREALGPRVPKKHASYLERVRNNTLDALASIEERLRERDRDAELHRIELHHANAKRAAAERERDYANGALKVREQENAATWVKLEAAEQRVAALERALREIEALQPKEEA